MNNKKNDAQLALEDALVQVEGGATMSSKQAAEEALTRIIERGRPFTSESVIAELGDRYAEIREPRLLGSTIRTAMLRGRIVQTGRWVKGLRVKRHSADVREWRPV